MSISNHPAAWDAARLLAECECRRQRRSGPGGQHRNKVETAVVITHLPTALRGEASERRSQEQNRRKALFRLRVNLAVSLRRPLDPAIAKGRVRRGSATALAAGSRSASPTRTFPRCWPRRWT